jgi:RNA polymerase sigma-B factor
LRPTVWRIENELEETGKQVTSRDVAKELARRKLEKISGDSPSEELVTAEAKKLQFAVEVIRQGDSYVPLDAPVGPQNSMTLSDKLEDPQRVDEIAVTHDLLTQAFSVINSDKFTDRQRTVFQRRFFEGKTQSEIANEIGCTQMHVSRILSKGATILRKEIGIGEFEKE